MTTGLDNEFGDEAHLSGLKKTRSNDGEISKGSDDSIEEGGAVITKWSPLVTMTTRKLEHPPASSKKKDFIAPTSDEMNHWLERCKEEQHNTESAFKTCFAGMKLFQALKKPIPFNEFMKEYLGTAATMDPQLFAIAWKMLNQDFGKYIHQRN